MIKFNPLQLCEGFLIIFVNIMAKPNKENIITEILVLLESGTNRHSCLTNIVDKWQISTRTFDRYWKSANEIHLDIQNDIKSHISEVSVEVFRQGFTGKVLNKLERQEILTQIALGELPMIKHIVADGIIQEREVRPDWNARKNAIAELNKMDGSYVQKTSSSVKAIEFTIIKNKQ